MTYVLGVADTTILQFCVIEITRVIVFCSFMHNVIDVMSKRLVFQSGMNMYAIFHIFSVIEVDFADIKIEAVL